MGAPDSQFHPKPEADVSDAENLKYLGFIQTAVVYAIFYLSGMYAYGKDKSGPLKPGVESVEDAVKTVVSPLYHKFQYFPIEFLRFVDRKMDASMTNLDNRIPPVVKQVSTQAFSAAQMAPEVARGVVSELRRDGVVGAAKNVCVKCEPAAKELYSKYEPAAKELYSKYEPAAKELYSKYEPAAKELYSKYEPAAKELYSKYEPSAKELYSKYEPVAEKYALKAWQGLNQLPLFPQVAEMVVPTAAYCSEMYNQAVLSKAENGCTAAGYLPLVPTEKIAKVFSAEKHEAGAEIPVS